MDDIALITWSKSIQINKENLKRIAEILFRAKRDLQIDFDSAKTEFIHFHRGH
jgi:hypothetical protein